MLTPNQLQIAHLRIQGLSYPQIGKQLAISHRTVEVVTHRIYRQLSVHNTRQLSTALHRCTSAGTPLGDLVKLHRGTRLKSNQVKEKEKEKEKEAIQ